MNALEASINTLEEPLDPISQRLLTRKSLLYNSNRPAKRLRSSAETNPHPNDVIKASPIEPSTPALLIDESITTLKSTPYDRSFASRLYGRQVLPTANVDEDENPLLIFRDWETEPPWMKLMQDIKRHYQFKHYGLDNIDNYRVPIEYLSLHRRHLPQVHDLLARTFWPGVDITSALEDSSKGYTVVTMYKHIVIGVALISPPPNEGYIPYVAVKAGWEHSGIALTMLYYLISRNQNRDIILHVSANNPALILYNKLGFKSEEFIVDFYEDYLDPQSRACRNALRLRLRQT